MQYIVTVKGRRINAGDQLRMRAKRRDQQEVCTFIRCVHPRKLFVRRADGYEEDIYAHIFGAEIDVDVLA